MEYVPNVRATRLSAITMEKYISSEQPAVMTPGPYAFFQYHRDSAGRWVLVADLDVRVRTERDDDGGRYEREREQSSGEFGDLAGQGKDAGTDHHARAHGDGAEEGERVLFVSGHALVGGRERGQTAAGQQSPLGV